jgi:hypothetical protein
MSETKTFRFDALPKNTDELKALPEADMKDPYAAAALAVAALCEFPENREASYEMINYLKGPADLSPMDKQFIRDRFMDGKDYLPFSYFEGAVPGNNYTPDKPYTISVFDNPHSRENEGYIRLFVRSGGADSERPVTLRNKPSTGEWFLWEFSSLLVGIRIPVKDDAWA